MALVVAVADVAGRANWLEHPESAARQTATRRVFMVRVTFLEEHYAPCAHGYQHRRTFRSSSRVATDAQAAVRWQRCLWRALAEGSCPAERSFVVAAGVR